MYICVDFDGTIVDHDFPRIGKPAPGAIEALVKLNRLGHKIILFTMRSDTGPNDDHLTQAVDYLKDNGVELFGINRNPTQDNWTTSPKAYGNTYIDDAAFGCPMITVDGFKRPCVDWKAVMGKLGNVPAAGSGGKK